MNRLLLILAFASTVNSLISQQVMTPETLWKLKRLSGGKVSPDGKKVLYEIRSFSIEENKGNTDLFVYDLKKGTETQVTTTAFSEMEAQWGKDNKIWVLSS
jgi:Tol biopolymer transport system component